MADMQYKPSDLQSPRAWLMCACLDIDMFVSRDPVLVLLNAQVSEGDTLTLMNMYIFKYEFVEYFVHSHIASHVWLIFGYTCLTFLIKH